MRLSSVLKAAESPITVIYGVGNHQYPNTKHSLGQVLVETLAAKAAQVAGRNGPPSFTWNKALHAWTCTIDVPLQNSQMDLPRESQMIFMKSKYPMNLSGYSAVQLCKRGPAKQSLASQLFFVAHDELSIAPGKFKFQLGGSPKGHNGLRDLIKQLKTEEFHRLRIGIGRPSDVLNTEINGKSRPAPMSIAEWCLSATTRDEVNLNTQLDSELVKGAWSYIEQQRIKELLLHHRPDTPEGEEK